TRRSSLWRSSNGRGTLSGGSTPGGPRCPHHTFFEVLGLDPAKLGDWLLAEDHLPPDPVPVVGRPKLSQDPEHQAERPARDDLVGRQAHLPEARPAHVAVFEH